MADSKTQVLKGPYDRVAAQLAYELRADAVVLVVWRGAAGTSGSVAANSPQEFLKLHALVQQLLNPPVPE